METNSRFDFLHHYNDVEILWAAGQKVVNLSAICSGRIIMKARKELIAKGMSLQRTLLNICELKRSCIVC